MIAQPSEDDEIIPTRPSPAVICANGTAAAAPVPPRSHQRPPWQSRGGAIETETLHQDRRGCARPLDQPAQDVRDPKSLESFYPYFSRRSPDALIKRRYVRAPPQWGRPAHNLANVTDDQLSAGETAQVIETVAGRWQIHQFGTAILISPGHWRLLCGQRGTQDAMGNPTAAGAWLIVLKDDIAPVSIAKSAVGMPWNWRIGPARSPAANGLNVAITSTPSARGAHSCSPTQFQRAAQGGSDQRLTWPRRICAATGDSGVLLKVPLG